MFPNLFMTDNPKMDDNVQTCNSKNKKTHILCTLDMPNWLEQICKHQKSYKRKANPTKQNPQSKFYKAIHTKNTIKV